MLLRRAAIVLVLSLLATQGVTAQPPTERQGPNRGAVASRAPDGRPDLQGVWHYATATPLQRFPEFADRPFISDEEAAAWVVKQLSERSSDIRNKNPDADLGRENNDFWFERPVGMAKIDGRVMTSLVVDPPTGRVPILPKVASGPPPDPNRADNPEDRNPGERCLAHPAGPPMVGGGPGSHYLQIVQTPSYIMLYAEAANTARIISTINREHAPGDMRQWRGDSVGWWEGEIFVVETVNSRIGANLRGFGVAPPMSVRTGPDFHLIERFSLAAPDVLLYEFTVTNPKFFAQPWTARAPMARTNARMFEFACHEGNYGLEFILRGARAAEKEQQPQE
jgi:hypothetical protein